MTFPLPTPGSRRNIPGQPGVSIMRLDGVACGPMISYLSEAALLRGH